MDPTSLETILMLKLNKHLWDARDTETLRRKAPEERATERRMNFPTPSSAVSAAPAPFLCLLSHLPSNSRLLGVLKMIVTVLTTSSLLRVRTMYTWSMAVHLCTHTMIAS